MQRQQDENNQFDHHHHPKNERLSQPHCFFFLSVDNSTRVYVMDDDNGKLDENLTFFSFPPMKLFFAAALDNDWEDGKKSKI